MKPAPIFISGGSATPPAEATVAASANSDGNNPAAYNAADIANYKYLKIAPAAGRPAHEKAFTATRSAAADPCSV